MGNLTGRRGPQRRHLRCTDLSWVAGRQGPQRDTGTPTVYKIASLWAIPMGGQR